MRIFKKNDRTSINFLDVPSRGVKSPKNTPKTKSFSFTLKWKFEGEETWRKKTISVVGTELDCEGDMFDRACGMAEGVLFAQSLIENVWYEVHSSGVIRTGKIQKK